MWTIYPDFEFVPSKTGEPHFFSTSDLKSSKFLFIDGYKYHRHRSGTCAVTPTNKLRWRCSKFKAGCKAIAYTVFDEIAAIRLNGYLYSYHIRREMAGFVKTRWYCTTHHSRGCRASLYTIEDQIVSCKTEHNHESVAMPSRDLNTYSSMRYKFEKSTKGTRVLVIDGYRFNSRSKSNKSFYAKVMWRCSRNRAGCKVCAYTFEDQLLVVKKQHNHPPPRNSSYGSGSTKELK
ncbi:hypothetical protein MSG28_008205 [Choristoneura fumiferana]|uniref:Uncharacterized protein n=2 Tax=Choristoneura fumiferana TaxID=7141 RepID=A0ACC0JAE9_CHOFU|nr:hypothetical protein MSG28_008205 [Choristoneura fumiferana]